jgi:hypothetical protein
VPNLILPYPFQLPQDIYAKTLPQPPVPVLPTPPEQPPITAAPPVDTTASVNNGGIYYGSTPPDSPLYGWLWTNTNGALYVYMEPGVWSQVGTNW